MAGVSDTGFESKDIVEIIESITERANTPEFFGEEFPAGPDSVFGVQTGVISGSIIDNWNLGQEVASQQNRDEATGIYLDYLAGIIGLTRFEASGSNGQLLFLGTQGTAITQFFPVADSAGRNVLTNNPIDLNRSLSYQSIFSVGNILPVTDYTIIVNSDTFTYTSDGTPTESEILIGLDALISTSLDVTVQIVGSTLELTNIDSLNNVSTTNTSNLVLDLVGVLVDSTSAETGALLYPANTLTILVGTNPGISSVTNLLVFTLGRLRETDAELRIRMAISDQRPGTATKPKIEVSLLAVAGVLSSLVVENDTMNTVDGIPPKSYEPFITGGDEGQIAEVIWETKPAAIQTFGDITRVVIDDNGDPQSVKFSRQTDRYAWQRVTYSINNEETFPADGEDGMRDAVVLAGSNMTSGEDYETTKFYGPLYTVPGTYISLIETAVTALPGDTPTYGTALIPVDRTETLIFDTTRVVITT